MSRDDYYTPPVLLIGRTLIQRFADDLIMAGHETTAGLVWRPFHSRRAVEAELSRRGYELVVDCSDHRVELLRFWASRPVGHSKEWWQSWNEVRQARAQESAARVALPRELEALAKELHR